MCLARHLPPATPPPSWPVSAADKVADWAVGACRELSSLTYPAAAKALLSLALRGRGAAAAPPPGPAPAGAAALKREPGCGDDLDLLVDVAADLRQMINAEGGCGLRPSCSGLASMRCRQVQGMSHRVWQHVWLRSASMCATRVRCAAPPCFGLLPSPLPADEDLSGEAEGEHFSVLSMRTHVALLTIMGAHLEGTLG